MINVLGLRLGAVVVAATLGLVACGGGSSSSTAAAAGGSGGSGGVTSTIISGTAASGAPIIGKVTVKDSKGAQKTVDIAADGSYNVDVAGMTAPFLFRAVGTVAGRQVSYASSATAADVGNTINVTPFTDLIVANIAGVAASQFFDNPDYAKLTSAEIEAARTTLTARLLPILKSAGVADSFDLLHSSFKADHTAFDAAMDAISVTVDASTKKAIIKDLINNTQIEDALDSKTDVTVLPAPTVAIKTGLDEVASISANFKSLTALFAKGLPAASNATLLNVFSADLLDDGLDRSTFLTDNLLDPALIGGQFLSVELVERVSANKILTLTHVKNSLGVEYISKTYFVKESEVWRFYGNRHHTPINLTAVNSRRIRAGQADVYERRMEVFVDDYANNQIQYFTVAGPGITGTIGYIRSTTNGVANFNVDGYSYSSTQISECGTGISGPCVNFAQVTNDAEYTVTYFDKKNGNLVSVADKLSLPRPPVSNADALANVTKWFAAPDLSKFAPASYKQISSTVTGPKIVWTNPLDPSYTPVNIGIYFSYDTLGDGASFSSDLAASDTSYQFGFLLPAGKSLANAPSFWIFTQGAFNRRFITEASYPGN